MKTLIMGVVLLGLFATVLHQASASQPALGLSRLKGATIPQSTRIDEAKFAIDNLAASDGVGLVRHSKNNLDYLSLDGGGWWSRPLRGDRHQQVAVSFFLLASQSTTVDIGGARLGFSASLADDNLQLMYDDASAADPQWRSLGLYLPLEKHDGHYLAAAPVLTVQIEPVLGIWHVFAGSRLLAYGLPLLPNTVARVTVKGGNNGALICGLVQSDENPLFADDNGNGIDDAFEKQHGTLLPVNAPPDARTATVKAWKSAQRYKPPVALSYTRPSPD